MNLYGGPQTVRSCAPAHTERVLISSLPDGLIFFYCKFIYMMYPALSVYKVKAKLNLCLIKHHALKVWGVVYSSTFKVSALESGKLPVVRPSQFKIGKGPVTHTFYLMLPA